MNMSWEIGAVDRLEENFKEFSLEKTVQKTLKTPEEIEQLTVDENLSDIERAVYLIETGEEIQQISVIRNLPELLRVHNADCMSHVIPKIKDLLQSSGVEFHLETAESFNTLIATELVTPTIFSQTFLPCIVPYIDHKNHEVSEAWFLTLLEICSVVSKETLQHDLFKLSALRGELSQTVSSRISASKILAKISTRCDESCVVQDILPLVKSLCQDIDYEVRGCMCRQLHLIAKAAGFELTVSAILPELVELSEDEESIVRLACLETVANLLNMLDDETCTHTIVPLVNKFCDKNVSANMDTNNLPQLAELFGRLCHGLSVNLNEDQRSEYLSFYQKLCASGVQDNGAKQKNNTSILSAITGLYDDDSRQVECRRACAYNFPAMLMFADASNFKSELYAMFHNMCNDTTTPVRRCMAFGVHEVAKQLGQTANIIQPEVISLLNSPETEVLVGLVANLPCTLETLAKNSTTCPYGENLLTASSELVGAILACEHTIALSNDWRLHTTFIEKVSLFTKCFTSDAIYSKFVPVVFRILTEHPPLPVRQAASRTMCTLLRNNKRHEHRQEMMQTLTKELCHGDSFYKRVMFIDFCKNVMDLFSKAFFKEHIFENILELGTDLVADVRLHFCSILPKLKTLIKLPSDRILLQRLEHCVRKMLTQERNTYVSSALRMAVMELDRIEVTVESISNRLLTESDVIDQKKEEEEHLIEKDDKDRKDDDLRNRSGKNKTDKTTRKLSNKTVGKVTVKRTSSGGSASNIPGALSSSPPTNASSKPPVQTGSKNAKVLSKSSPMTSNSVSAKSKLDPATTRRRASVGNTDAQPLTRKSSNPMQSSNTTTSTAAAAAARKTASTASSSSSSSQSTQSTDSRDSSSNSASRLRKIARSF